MSAVKRLFPSKETQHRIVFDDTDRSSFLVDGAPDNAHTLAASLAREGYACRVIERTILDKPLAWYPGQRP